MNRTFWPRLFALTFLISATFAVHSHAQLIMNMSERLQIPGIKNINSSETHLYALSESEGLVVFRAYADSLQWLYSSTGMQERGHILESDIRFAYLYGNNRRLTVIEPTSVLGVYSSTILPAQPLSVKRMGQRLFVAMGRGGLGYLSLETPETVDSDVQYLTRDQNVINLATDRQRTLYALNNNNLLSVFDVTDDEITQTDQVEVNRTVHRLFLTSDELYGTDRDGTIFLINSDGNTRTVARVSNPVERLSIWNDLLIVRTENQEIYTGSLNSDLEPWKTASDAGNFFTITSGSLWVSEHDVLAPVVISDESNAVAASSGSGNFNMRSIPDIIIPAPRPLLLPIEFESEVDMSQVSISYTAPFDNARIRGKSFFWQPSSGQTGRHQVTLTATKADGRSTSQTFTVDIRPFNSPPRFSPARPLTIPVGEEFELGITATDPDGLDRNLIRYLGVDMPEGASLNEKTGEFTWTPHARQVGEHTFEVIATDQFGAAASQNFTLTVIEITEDELDEEELF